MSKVLVIGAGGVSSVAVHKMAMNSAIFSHISLASRTLSKCDAIAESIRARTGVTVDTYVIDAEDIPALSALIRRIGPKLVVNLALPYQDLAIMEACLQTGVHYLDTANYEPRHEAKFEYRWQWDLHERFTRKGPDGAAGQWLRSRRDQRFCDVAQEAQAAHHSHARYP